MSEKYVGGADNEWSCSCSCTHAAHADFVQTALQQPRENQLVQETGNDNSRITDVLLK